MARSARKLGALTLWALAVAGVLFSAMVLLLIPARWGEQGRQVEAFFVAQLSPLPSERDIARLGAEILTWPGVEHVAFRFPGETDPVPIPARALLVRLSRGARDVVEERLKTIPEVEKVEYVEKTVVTARLPPVSRLAAVAALVLTLALSLWLGARGTAQAMHAWREELALLRALGWPEGWLRLPFWGLGLLVGGVAGLLFLGLAWALWFWGPASPAIASFVPYFPRVWPGLLVLGVLVGALLGVVGAVLGSLELSAHS